MSPGLYFAAAAIAAVCAAFVDRATLAALLIGAAGLLIMGLLDVAIRRSPSRPLRAAFAATGVVTFCFGMAVLGGFL